MSQLFRGDAEELFVELSLCPYDHTPIEAEARSGGSVVLSCPACDAAWEWHGAWIGRFREPDRAKVLEARARARARAQATEAS